MNDKKRAEFEKWFPKELEDKAGVKSLMWHVWQAAIASVVVELPRPSSAVDYGYELNDIQNTLTDAGIRYE